MVLSFGKSLRKKKKNKIKKIKKIKWNLLNKIKH